MDDDLIDLLMLAVLSLVAAALLASVVFMDVRFG